MEATQYAVKLTGTTPLLMHNDNLQWADAMEKWRKDPENKKHGVAGDDRSPAWTWVGSVYHEDDMVVIPADNLMTVLREGGKRVGTGKRGASFKAMTQSGIVVDQIAWPLAVKDVGIPYAEIASLVGEKDFAKHEALTSRLGFSLFVKRARIGQAKHVRVRPRFDAWSCEGTMTVIEESITRAVLHTILEQAGRYAGLCDWRPSSPKSPGRFGCFTAEVKAL